MKGYRKNEIVRNVLICLIYMIIIFFMYRTCIFGNKLTVGGDGTGYLNQKIFWANSIKNGEFALWNPYIGIGNPFAADVQNAVYDPTNLLYLCFNPVLAFNLAYIVKLTFAAFFMYLLVKEITEKDHVAIMAGMIYSFSGMLGGRRMEHVTIITTIVLFPLILYLLEKYRKSLKTKFLLLSSLAMAFQFVTGFTQIVLYFDIILFGYFLYIGISQKIPWKRQIVNCCLWVGAYLLAASVQLLPLIMLMKDSLKRQSAWGAFTVLAYDLRVLGLMFFPKLFANYFEAWGDYSSSGMDIEIYIGIVSMVYITYLVRYHFQKTKCIRIFSLLGIAALIYGMLPKIPVVNKLLFQVPLLNSFRAAGRALLIFVFFAILLTAIGMAKMDTKDEIKKVIKINIGFIIGLCLIWFVVWSFTSQTVIKDILDEAYYMPFFKENKVLLLLLVCHLAFLCASFYIKESKMKNVLTVAVISIIIIGDVGRYSINRDRYAGEDIVTSTADENILSAVSNDTKNHNRSFSMTSFYNPNRDFQDIDVFKFNKSGILKQLVYNSYITFLDSRLSYWGIAETAVYANTLQMLEDRNDLISMMGIHSIINAGDSLVDLEYEMGIDKTSIRVADELLKVQGRELAANSEVQVENFEIGGLQADTIYRIRVNMETSVMPELFYVDFYNNNYDNPMQDGNFTQINVDGKEMEAFIRTKDIPDEEIYCRVIWQSTDHIILNNLEVEKIEADPLYQEVVTKDKYKIFENPHAEKILYVPSKIYPVDNYGISYQDSGMIDVNKNNYIIDYKDNVDLTDVNTEISDISIGSNYVTAYIVSDTDTFVNHSQLYTADWNAYIDGKRTKVYNVNNLIQGIEVPEGTHMIEFRYEPWSIYAGLALSIISIGIIFAFILKDRRKES